jgi:hypothetical protein
LVIDHRVFCHTLEDKVRLDPKDKIPGDTAIPSGRYRIALKKSNRFKRIMPFLENVPNFSAIEFHSGNNTNDTAGCVLLAYERSSDGLTIWNKSGIPKAVDALIELLKKEKENWIEIIRTFPYRAIF